MTGSNMGARILIIDDTPDHIAFAGAILKQQGYRVYAATSGAMAFRFLEMRRPDLIVLDVHMDEMDGLEVCQKLKENVQTHDIPVIFVTAETTTDIITKAFAVGCCDYVSKPFVREEYLARIGAHLSIARQARSLAEAYNELNLFCSAVSHDLKSPLGVMRLLLEQLEQEIGNQNGDVDYMLQMLKNKSSALSEMVDRLLDFSRMCNITPAFEDISLQKMVEETFAEQHMLTPTRNIALQCEILPIVRGDAVLLRIMLQNIMNNAFKFTINRQQAVITVSAVQKDEYTVLTIRDNGAGFDMQCADKLFGIFQRLHHAQEFPGTGVGLAMVEKIMKRHDGKVTMTGEIDKGAEISLYFHLHSV